MLLIFAVTIGIFCRIGLGLLTLVEQYTSRGLHSMAGSDDCRFVWETQLL
jgi:hypothetical protein